MPDINSEILEELENPTPPEPKQNDEVADTLTNATLETTLKKIIDEKLTLNESASDDEDLTPDEEEDEESKGLGIFPLLVITSVVVFGAGAIFMRNRTQVSHGEVPKANHG